MPAFSNNPLPSTLYPLPTLTTSNLRYLGAIEDFDRAMAIKSNDVIAYLLPIKIFVQIPQ
jgi:hypothetical protein